MMDARIPLKPGDVISENGINYVIGSKAPVGCDTAIIYEGSTKQWGGRAIIRECYPYGLGITRNEKGELCTNTNTFGEFAKALKSSDEMKRVLEGLHEKNEPIYFLSTEIAYISDNNTKYLVTNIREAGTTFSDFIKNKASLSLFDIIMPVYLLTYLASEYHKNGYLILDLNPERFLITTESGHPDSIELLSVGNVIKKNEIQKLSVFTYSRVWAAPELYRKEYCRIDRQTDLYGLGAILFSAVMGGRPPKYDDIKDDHEPYDFSDERCPECVKNMDRNIKKDLAEIFEHTIAYKGKRYEHTRQLAEKLENLLKSLALNKMERREMNNIFTKIDIRYDEQSYSN